MKHLQISFLVLFSSILFSACEKVIDFDLKDAETRIVIEGSITNGPAPYYIVVSKSQLFKDSTQLVPVTSAIIIVSDNTGISDTLSMILDGLYQTNNIVGVEGRTYTLTAYVEGKFFTSICTMPYAVMLDSLIAADDLTTNSGFALTPVYNDPLNTTNYYRFNAFEGQDHIPLVRVRNDNSTNGIRVSQPVGFENYYNPGDIATLEMWCVDKRIYDYFFGLSQTINTGLNAPASPGNPTSNIAGGCLGYFSAHTVQSKSVPIE